MCLRVSGDELTKALENKAIECDKFVSGPGDESMALRFRRLKQVLGKTGMIRATAICRQLYLVCEPMREEMPWQMRQGARVKTESLNDRSRAETKAGVDLRAGDSGAGRLHGDAARVAVHMLEEIRLTSERVHHRHIIDCFMRLGDDHVVAADNRRCHSAEL